METIKKDLKYLINILFLFISMGSVLLASVSCNSQLVGNYCNRSKKISSTLSLYQNKEFSLSTHMKFHESKIYFQTGSYHSVNNTLILLVTKEGSESEPLIPLSKIDTLKGYIRNNKITIDGESSNLILKKCFD